MIKDKGHSIKYLEDFRAGRISKGLDTGVPVLDQHLRFKINQLNMVLGFDNVGKTAWMMWYFLCLSVKHNIKWCIWSGENKSEQLIRDLIQMYAGQRLKDISIDKMYQYAAQIEDWFDFVSNENTYTSKQLLEIFRESDAQGCLIDPYTGLDRGVGHKDNYEFLNTTRQFVNTYSKTIYFNTHAVTEAARRLHPKEHDMAGHVMPPLKSHAEGGQPFANRVDDIIILHRYISHPERRYHTLVETTKIKDKETGGEPTLYELPITHEFNNGVGFICGGVNPLKRVYTQKTIETKPLQPNKDFEKEVEKPKPKSKSFPVEIKTEAAPHWMDGLEEKETFE